LDGTTTTRVTSLVALASALSATPFPKMCAKVTNFDGFRDFCEWAEARTETTKANPAAGIDLAMALAGRRQSVDACPPQQ
jgi:hypothetical protein